MIVKKYSVKKNEDLLLFNNQGYDNFNKNTENNSFKTICLLKRQNLFIISY